MIKLTQTIKGFNEVSKEGKMWKSISQVNSQPKYFNTEEAQIRGYSRMTEPWGHPSSVVRT